LSVIGRRPDSSFADRALAPDPDRYRMRRSVGASLTLPRQFDRMRRLFGDAERIAGMKMHQNA
jgi:hypothetical protein